MDNLLKTANLFTLFHNNGVPSCVDCGKGVGIPIGINTAYKGVLASFPQSTTPITITTFLN